MATTNDANGPDLTKPEFGMRGVDGVPKLTDQKLDHAPYQFPQASPGAPAQQAALALPQPAARGWKFWAVFVPMCVATLLVAVETTVTSTALPSIVADLSSGDLYVWIMNGYLLTSTVFQPLYGQFAQIWGRRWPSIFAVAVFTLGSAISGGATTTTMLIAGRVVQGIGGGGINLMTQLIVSDLVSVRARGKYIGIVFAVFGLGTTVGPVLGGVIAGQTTWRWVFWINLPIGGITLILQHLFLQVAHKKNFTLKQMMLRIDWIGNILLITSVISILLALSWANTRYPWSSWQILVPLLLGFAGTVCFHCFEASKYCKQPIIPPRLFTNRTCAVALILAFAQSMLTFWRIYFLPVYFQSVLLVSTERSGVLLLPTVTVGVPAAIISGLVLTKTGRYKPLHIGGFALLTLAAGLYTRFDASSSMTEVVVFQIIAGLGTGCVLTTLLPAAQADLPQALVAPVTSTWGFMRSYGSVWGVSIPAAIFNARFESLRDRISDPVVRAQLADGSGYAHASNKYIKPLVSPTREQVISVYAASLKLTWQIGLVFSALCFFVALLEKEVTMRKTVQSDFGLKEHQQKERKNQDPGMGQHMLEGPKKTPSDKLVGSEG